MASDKTKALQEQRDYSEFKSRPRAIWESRERGTFCKQSTLENRAKRHLAMLLRKRQRERNELSIA